MVSIEFSDVVKSYATDGEALGVDGDDVDGIAVATAADLDAHEGDTANPHDVTKEQVGLGNVDNTADADKPISTATQAALDGKQPLDADLTALAAAGFSAGANGRVVIAGVEMGVTPWINLTPQNGWTASVLRYRRDRYTTILQYEGLNGAAASSNTIATLPAGYRPDITTPDRGGANGSGVADVSVNVIVGSSGGVLADRTVVTGGRGVHRCQTSAAWPT